MDIQIPGGLLPFRLLCVVILNSFNSFVYQMRLMSKIFSGFGVVTFPLTWIILKLGL